MLWSARFSALASLSATDDSLVIRSSQEVGCTPGNHRHYQTAERSELSPVTPVVTPAQSDIAA